MIKSAVIQLHDNKNEICKDKQDFGIIKINMHSQTTPIKKHQHFVFSIDESGSMSDLCNDGRTKMRHILFTLENMIRIFAEKYDNMISIHVNAFSNDTYTVIHNTFVQLSNVDELIEKIKKIRPKDSTNIEDALIYANKDIEEYKRNNNNAFVTHLFLTDGEPTIGCQNAQELKKYVSPDYPNIFIGYGNYHDPYLMCELAHHKNGQYFYIDALENASIVYGEIIHNLLYKFEENVIITIQNGEIYNYKTNTWETELYIGNLVSDMEKIYQIRTVPVDPQSIISATIQNENIEYPINLSDEVCDLTKYIFRQKTQELLYKVKMHAFKHSKPKNSGWNLHIPRVKNYKHTITNINNNNINNNNTTNNTNTNNTNTNNNNTNNNNTNTNTNVNIKQELYDFFEVLTNYIKVNKLEDDKFLKMLCDDMYIAYNSFGKRYSALLSCARQTSQGSQTTYNVGIPEDDDTPSELFFNYSLSDSMDSPYSTQGVIDTMNVFSCEPDTTPL